MRMFAIVVLALAAVLPAAGIDQAVTRVDVSLGDVSINKVPQLVAADQGLYAKYGLDVHQTISAGAARAAAASGVVVPDSYVNKDPSLVAPIQVGGGSPMIYGFVRNAGAARVVVLTQEPIVMDHLIGKPGISGHSGPEGETHRVFRRRRGHAFRRTQPREEARLGSRSGCDARRRFRHSRRAEGGQGRCDPRQRHGYRARPTGGIQRHC